MSEASGRARMHIPLSLVKPGMRISTIRLSPGPTISFTTPAGPCVQDEQRVKSGHGFLFGRASAALCLRRLLRKVEKTGFIPSGNVIGFGAEYKINN